MGDPTKVVILVVVIELLAMKIQPWAPLTAVEQSGEGTKKVYNPKKSRQRKIPTKTRLQGTRKLGQWL